MRHIPTIVGATRLTWNVEVGDGGEVVVSGTDPDSGTKTGPSVSFFTLAFPDGPTSGRVASRQVAEALAGLLNGHDQ
jgi:hypothetical protein